MTFKTNIMCGACIEKVTPVLNELVGENNWKVDIKDPNKILCIPDSVKEEQLVSALKNIGYRTEKIK